MSMCTHMNILLEYQRRNFIENLISKMFVSEFRVVQKSTHRGYITGL